MAAFDPYHKWLGIPPADQPPNHYRLLGLNLFESDLDVIDVATEQRVVYLRQCATGPHVAASQKLLNEVAAARLCLFNVEIKRLYDQGLRMTISSSRDSEQLDSVTESDGGNRAATDDSLSQHSNQSRHNHMLAAWLTASARARFVIVAGPLLMLAVLVGWLVSDPVAHESFPGATAGQERDDNSLKMKFCWWPPDTFTMGSPKSDAKGLGISAADESRVGIRWPCRDHDRDRVRKYPEQHSSELRWCSASRESRDSDGRHRLAKSLLNGNQERTTSPHG